MWMQTANSSLVRPAGVSGEDRFILFRALWVYLRIEQIKVVRLRAPSLNVNRIASTDEAVSLTPGFSQVTAR